MFRIGTAKVSGTDKAERIDVIVEIYIELQAPPEQTVNGIESDDRILSKISWNNDFSDGLSGSIKLRSA